MIGRSLNADSAKMKGTSGDSGTLTDSDSNQRYIFNILLFFTMNENESGLHFIGQ